MLHTDPGAPLTIGRGCTIGHKAILHGCTIGDNSLIGMGATVLNHARIGANCLVGANALVTEGKEFPGQFADRRRAGARRSGCSTRQADRTACAVSAQQLCGELEALRRRTEADRLIRLCGLMD